MIRREGDAILLEGPLTLATVASFAEAMRDHLRQGARVVDFKGVTEVDSSAIALALEWLRQVGEDAPGAPKFANLPAAMQNLAKLYGVSELLQPASS